MPYTVYLKKGEEKRVLQGHSWVYANEVARIDGKDKNGSLATVCAYDGKFIGKGYINHLSKILVRIFIRDENQIDDENLYIERITKAKASRTALGYDNCYRAIFAEADNLPALIVDKYDDYLVCQFLSLGIDKQKDTIVDSLVKVFAPKGIYERSDVAVRQKEGLEERTGVLYGEVPDKIVADENGLKMSVDVKTDKNGIFSRPERKQICRAQIRKGQSVGLFCNSGGFSLNCALSAKEVISCDISKTALENVEENASLNGFTNIKTKCADVFDALREYKNNGEKFDLVILDPPAFCKSASEVKDAYRGYKDINVLGMKLVKSGGYLISSSCSHYMTFPLFEKCLWKAQKKAEKSSERWKSNRKHPTIRHFSAPKKPNISNFLFCKSCKTPATFNL